MRSGDPARRSTWRMSRAPADPHRKSAWTSRPADRGEGKFAIIIPQRVSRYILDDDRLTPEGSRATGTGTRANRFAIDTPNKRLRKIPRRAVAYMNAVRIQQKNRAKHTGALRLITPSRESRTSERGFPPRD